MAVQCKARRCYESPSRQLKNDPENFFHASRATQISTTRLYTLPSAVNILPYQSQIASAASGFVCRACACVCEVYVCVYVHVCCVWVCGHACVLYAGHVYVCVKYVCVCVCICACELCVCVRRNYSLGA